MAAKDHVLKDFDPQEFLKRYSEVKAWHTHPLKALHGLFQSFEATPADLKIQDFGCSPILILSHN